MTYQDYMGKGPKFQSKPTPEAEAEARRWGIVRQLRSDMRGYVRGLEVKGQGRRFHIVKGDFPDTFCMYEIVKDSYGRDSMERMDTYRERIYFNAMFGDDDDIRHEIIMREWERDEETFDYVDLEGMIK